MPSPVKTSGRIRPWTALAAAGLLLGWCLPAAAGKWMDDQTIVHDGKVRHFRAWVPDSLPAGHPVVFLLHGGSGSMHELNSGAAEWPAVADDAGFLLIVPNGVDPDTGDFSSDNQQWNDCRGDVATRPSVEDDVGFIGALIDWAASSFDPDLERVYATGASNGGMMSYRLAFELGDRIAAIAAFIANLPAADECSPPGRPIPVFIANGEGETNYMPWDGGCVVAAQGCERGRVGSALEARDFWVAHNRCDPVPARTTDYPDIAPDDGATARSEFHRNCDQGGEVIFYTVFGGGHNTPTIRHPIARWVLDLLGPIAVLLLTLGVGAWVNSKLFRWETNEPLDKRAMVTALAVLLVLYLAAAFLTPAFQMVNAPGS